MLRFKNMVKYHYSPSCKKSIRRFPVDSLKIKTQLLFYSGFFINLVRLRAKKKSNNNCWRTVAVKM